MESLISTFHVDAGLFIAQVINFAVVFSVLYFFALKPLVKIMNERSAKIDQSLKEADEIGQRLTAAAAEKEEIVSAARKQAEEILAEGEKKNEEKRSEMLAKAKAEIGQVINEEKLKLGREKAETLKEIKKDVSDLVISVVEKLLSEKMTDAKDRDLIKKLVK